MKQFVLPSEPALNSGQSVKYPLEGKAFHYLVHVRRYRAGDSVIAVSPSMARFTMVINSIERNRCMVELQVVENNKYGLEQPELAITLMPAILKGKKMDLVIRQAVEAGVARVCPILTEHTEVHYRKQDDSLVKTERWKRIATETIQQCGGQYPTAIASPTNLDTVLDNWNEQELLLFFHEKAVGEKMGLHHWIAKTDAKLTIVTGPEGGFSKTEVQRLQKAGGKGICLGHRILRAETAVLYGLAAVSTISRERKQWNPI